MRFRAWVLESSVSPFTAANLQANFLIKKFKGDKDYRAAVVEAVRLIQHRGETVDETFLELLKTCQNVNPLLCFLPSYSMCSPVLLNFL